MDKKNSLLKIAQILLTQKKSKLCVYSRQQQTGSLSL